MLELDRSLCSDISIAEAREWLVTNGIGGYASGTVAGTMSSRYHGLLIAALKPPLARTLLLAKLDELVVYNDQSYRLYANRWGPDSVETEGLNYLERFYLEGTTPVWVYALADAVLEKRVWMQQGSNTTYIRYEMRRGTLPLQLDLKALVNYRDHHSNTHANWAMHATTLDNGLQVQAFEDATPFYLFSDGANFTPHATWIDDLYLKVEQARGLDPRDSQLHIGTWRISLSAGEQVTIVASTDPAPSLDSQAAYQERRQYEQHLIERSGLHEPALQHLTLAADQFIVKRAVANDPDGLTVLAGYPWFEDWGRDTMISLVGLTLSVGRPEVAKRILRTFAHFVNQGMLPNRFPELGQHPEYNTVDATLWYFEAIRAYVEVTTDHAFLTELYPILEDIIAWHQRGTRYNIHVDPDDSLLYAGEAGSQLTWMDVKIGDWVVTPRRGKPIEINALWLNALHSMAAFADALGKPSQPYRETARLVEQSFSRFWNAECGYCYDVLDTPHGDDDNLRPNQLIAVALPHCPLTPEQQQAVVDICARQLLTSHGLRSLAPNHSDYIGTYGGDQIRRDSAYHQGTVWGWLIGPFVAAHLHVYQDPVLARSYIIPLIHQIESHAMGTLSEVFEGNPPFKAGGCIAQAWSVAEVLRVWTLLNQWEIE
ncbi:MAG: glycogen debranching enzyme family protein [Anaerolineales bacterium]|nr:glycogen debranching enzyme family protein [Anaerolineales bacterium]